MLFNYNNCLSCKKKIDDVKITLHQLFPANICNKICEYNVHCKYCHLLVEDERKFSKHRQEENVSKIELQLRFFQLYNKPPFEWKDVKKVKVQKLNAIIDNNGNDDIMFNKAMKSYFNLMYIMFIKDYIPAIGNKEKLKNETKHLSEIYFSYYKGFYREFSLIKLIIYEYLLALIGNDIEYIDLEDIHNYLDEIFPKIK